MKNQQQQITKNFIDSEEFWKMIEEQIDKLFESSNLKIVNLIQKAKNEGWLGARMPKDNKGLLGYFRTNFGKQIKILNNLGNHLPIWQSELTGFFRSDFFSDEVRRNGYVSEFLFKEEHFEFIKNKQL
jgi:hypothetical protein